MKLNKRQIKILSQLNDSNWTTGKEIAANSELSLRTIQSELSLLKKNSLILSSTKGYKLNESVDLSDYKMNDNNDMQLILNKLLSTDKPLNIYDLSDEFYLSESTLVKKLKQLNPLIENYNLKLTTDKNNIFIQGKEIDKRKMFKKMIFSNLPSDNFEESLSAYFDGLEVNTVKNIIFSSIADAGYYIQNSYSSGLLLGIMITLYRIYKGIHSMEKVEINNDDIEYILAKKICERFADHYNSYATYEDIQYISSLFQGQIYGKEHISKNDHSTFEFENKIVQILSAVLEDYLIVTDINKYAHNISLHINEMIKRCKANNCISNNLHTSMRENCPFIFDVAVSFAKKLENEYSITISDEEIGFLSVHIGLIIENDIYKENTIKILLLSENYHSIADNIKKKILSQNSNVEIYIKDMNYKIFNNNADIIITTGKVDVIGKTVLEVSPMYNIIDQSNVNAAISASLSEKEKIKYRNFMLSCFSPNLFFKRNDISDKNTAIEFLCDSLKEFGSVDANFKEDVFEREQISSTCFLNTFAIPHSIHMNAKKTTLAILINENGIIWDQNKIQICILIAMSRENRKQFSQLYNGIVQVLCDKSHLKNLINSKTLGEFMDNINQ